MAVFDTPLFTSDQSLDRVLKAGLPVLLVFLNGPAPDAFDQTLKDVAKQQAGQLLVVQLQLKDSPESARRFGINTAPALVAYKDGQVQAQSENIQAADVAAYVAYLLGKGSKPVTYPRQTVSSASSAASGSPTRNGSGGHPVVVTDATFDQEVMRSSSPVIVDFWAPWCGPCRMVAPTLDKLAREWQDRVKIAKVNVDENPGVSARFRITGIPMMMVVKNGRVVDQWTGALPEGPLRQRLSANI